MRLIATALMIALTLFTRLTVAQTPSEQLVPDVATAIKDSNKFALGLYTRLAEQDGNLFFSPYSISSALAMTYAGARGETAQQMANTLRFSLDQERLHGALHILRREIEREGPNAKAPLKYQLEIANRLWGQSGLDFLPQFLATTEKNYGAGLFEVDFINAREVARSTINTWVEEQTNDKIQDLIKPDVLSNETRLVLTNAIYFKAAWMRKFSPGKTVDEDFTLSDGSKVKTKLMRERIRTNFANGNGYKALELPYENNDLSMFVLLPNTADGLPSLEQQLRQVDLSNWLGELTDHAVDVSLPKFKVTSEFMLEKALSAMGMPAAFDRQQADFSGMTTREKLYISHVVHQAFVDVNEAGTEAAASTAIVMERLSLPPPATFRADHPFIYLIRDNRTGSILFMGRLVDPTVGTTD